MPTLRAQAPKETFARAASFDYHAEQRALEARVLRMMRSVEETTASLPAEPFDHAAQETPSAPSFRWRGLNWEFIGALLFTLLAWWVILTSAVPALHAIFNRTAA